MKTKLNLNTPNCLNCNENSISLKISHRDLNTGLKRGIGKLFLALVMMILGCFLIWLGVGTGDFQAAVFALGVVLGINGLINLIVFVSRKNEMYKQYTCSKCSYTWNRIGEDDDNEIIDKILKPLNSNDYKIIKETLLVISNLKDSRFINPLTEYLNTDDTKLKAYIIRTLGEIGDNQVLDRIIEATHDEDKSIRKSALSALSNFRFKKIINPLIDALDDEDKSVREASQDSLHKLSGEYYGDDKYEWTKYWEKH
ncbi:HEAT repeat domain-containing protein [Marinifilum sp. D737]|uniref:HEAT repeat domain-containing protein n=1 Tax=Marinifilum sp. D737 TaxID=2969628 RepID=UPI002274DBD4|nr:HEAT repeat domain-containing protein [Marinifilum sp. D737]MCY1636599.1 HEAT repeat domain-containing protein [Marinifilum sp. D737]